MRASAIGTDVDQSTAISREDHLQLLSAIISHFNGMRTLASIIVESSQPKFDITCVLVHIRSRTKNHASTRNAMVILSCCLPELATLSSL
jgi:hypothetical protein